MIDSLSAKFLKLKYAQKKTVHFMLGEYALRKWNAFIRIQGAINYIDSVVGIRHEVDECLPNNALKSAKSQENVTRIKEWYQEPITALQDGAFDLPENIKFAYYSIYNLFKKYALKEAVDDWLIVNQAISSEEDNTKWATLLSDAIRKAT